MPTNPKHAPRPSIARALALLALVLVGTGCPSFATRGSARTLEAGEWEVQGGLVVAASNALAHPSLETGPDDRFDYSGDDAYAMTELGVGVGLTDKVELGGRLLTPSYGNIFEPAKALMPSVMLDTKVQLARMDEHGQGLDVALAPTVMVPSFSLAGELVAYVQLPLLMGFNVSERNQVVLSPQLMVAMPHMGVSARQLIPSLGVAYLHRFESGWGVRPELTAISSPDNHGNPFQSTTVQAGFSLLKR